MTYPGHRGIPPKRVQKMKHHSLKSPPNNSQREKGILIKAEALRYLVYGSITVKRPKRRDASSLGQEDPWRRAQQPTPFPENPMDRGACGRIQDPKELDIT